LSFHKVNFEVLPDDSQIAEIKTGDLSRAIPLNRIIILCKVDDEEMFREEGMVVRKFLKVGFEVFGGGHEGDSGGEGKRGKGSGVNEVGHFDK